MEVTEDEGAEDVGVLHGDTVDFVAREEAKVGHPDVH